MGVDPQNTQAPPFLTVFASFSDHKHGAESFFHEGHFAIEARKAPT